MFSAAAGIKLWPYFFWDKVTPLTADHVIILQEFLHRLLHDGNINVLAPVPPSDHPDTNTVYPFLVGDITLADAKYLLK